MTHFTPPPGSVADALLELKAISIEMDADIRVLGCDGACVSPRRHAGICQLFELWNRQPVHRYICQLHVNELHWREVYVKLDGNTTDSKSFSGPIGKMVAGAVETAPVVDFNPVPGGVESADSDALFQLSHGQSLLYQLAVGMQSGHVPASVANRKTGPLNHARCLTLACRVLRVYVSYTLP